MLEVSTLPFLFTNKTRNKCLYIFPSLERALCLISMISGCELSFNFPFSGFCLKYHQAQWEAEEGAKASECLFLTKHLFLSVV